MSILEIKKLKTKSPKGNWFTFEVDNFIIIKGIIYVIPKSEKYQFFKILLSDCVVVK